MSLREKKISFNFGERSGSLGALSNGLGPCGCQNQLAQQDLGFAFGLGLGGLWAWSTDSTQSTFPYGLAYALHPSWLFLLSFLFSVLVDPVHSNKLLFLKTAPRLADLNAAAIWLIDAGVGKHGGGCGEENGGELAAEQAGHGQIDARGAWLVREIHGDLIADLWAWGTTTCSHGRERLGNLVREERTDDGVGIESSGQACGRHRGGLGFELGSIAAAKLGEWRTVAGWAVLDGGAHRWAWLRTDWCDRERQGTRLGWASCVGDGCSDNSWHLKGGTEEKTPTAASRLGGVGVFP